jgi:hypothetical protein
MTSFDRQKFKERVSLYMSGNIKLDKKSQVYLDHDFGETKPSKFQQSGGFSA